MCVYVCVCVHVCVYVCVCVRVLCVCACVCVRVRVLCVRVLAHACMHACEFTQLQAYYVLNISNYMSMESPPPAISHCLVGCVATAVATSLITQLTSLHNYENHTVYSIN